VPLGRGLEPRAPRAPPRASAGRRGASSWSWARGPRAPARSRRWRPGPRLLHRDTWDRGMWLASPPAPRVDLRDRVRL